jgi:hypothetical protein
MIEIVERKFESINICAETTILWQIASAVQLDAL